MLISGLQKLSVVTSLVLGGVLALGEDLSPIASSENYAWGQIASDNTLGSESSLVTSPIPGAFQIDGGATRGTNLFHSFSQFSVPTSGSAYFNNAVDIQNIISRVTGGSVSNIDGLLRANGTANLFLLNPNGIIFGPNASLNIGGTFVGSTASNITFADATHFSATAPQTTPLLTVSVPIGLQFGSTAAEIRVQGPGAMRDRGLLVNRKEDLFVQPSKTLALVGSGVALEGGILTTDGGRIELGSVAGPSLVSLTPIDKGWVLGYEGVSTFGDIHLSGAAASDVSGAGGGDIQVRGKQVTLTNGSRIEASTLGAEPGGTLNVAASESVELIGRSANGQFSGLVARVYPGATGSGGNLTVETVQLGVRDRALISTETFGNGDGGNLTVKTGRLIVQGGGRIETSTSSTGQGGDLTVRASESVELIGIAANLDSASGLSGLINQVNNKTATGSGGDLSVETQRLIIRDGARISTSTDGEGNGGDLTVIASELVKLIGTTTTPANVFRSGLFAVVDRDDTGAGGNITVETRRLSVLDGATVTTANQGEGLGGNLTVKASESVELSGLSDNAPAKQRFSRLRTQATRRQNSGIAGNLLIETGQLTLRDQAEVNVSSLGSGNPGNLIVTARSIHLDKASLSSETKAGQGNIFLHSQDLVLRRGSKITTNATGTASGGNIDIDTGVLVALENSDIRANAQDARGGRVIISAQGIFGTEFREDETPESDITARSRLGRRFRGTVDINTPDVNPSQGLTELPDAPVNTEVAEGCQMSGKQASVEFFNTGRGGIAPNPYEPLSSSNIWEDVPPPTQEAANSAGAASTSASPATLPDKVVEAQGWLINEKGEVILVAEVPTPLSQSRCRLR